ncbi:hypothetical protein REC12_24910 [Desulfosporosinus sp. PR]|nr:hypothetical protein [Desulfosporosinus sp. PR]
MNDRLGYVTYPGSSGGRNILASGLVIAGVQAGSIAEEMEIR